jgi:hypothetical protein
MLFFKQKKEIEFRHKVDLVRKLFPIYQATKLPMAWRKKLNKYIKENDFNLQNTSLCSGIHDLLNMSHVVTSVTDISIRTNGDGQNFKWEIPTPAISKMVGYDAVSHFEGWQYGDHIELPVNTLKTIVKIQTGWKVRLPKDYVLMLSPLTYNEENRFTAFSGILDPTISNELNVPLFWHILDGQTIIEAGTPLALLTPIKQEKFNFLIKESDFEDEENRNRLLYSEAISFSKPSPYFLKKYNK